MKRMEGKLIDAYNLLFGTHNHRGGMGMLQHLDMAAVRRAYRVLAVANHPDTARRGGGRQSALDGKMFIEVSRAYELLMGYLINRPKHPSPAQSSARGADHRPHGTEEKRAGEAKWSSGEKKSAGEQKRSTGAQGGAGEKRHPGDQKRANEQKRASEHKGQAGERHAGAGRAAGAAHASGASRATGERRATGEARSSSDQKRASGEKRSGSEPRGAGEKRSASASRSAPLYYHGPVPRRRLRLAEFLYYTGRISWQSLIAAIVWQRAAQPRFGELAKELRSISGPDVARILSSRLRNEQTGQTAQRLKLLTPAQVEKILRLQRARRKPIGRFFVEKNGFNNAKLGEIIWEMHRHNARHGK